MNANPALMRYVAAGVTAVAAAGLAVGGRFIQAAVLAAGAAFLIYWARQDSERGER